MSMSQTWLFTKTYFIVEGYQKLYHKGKYTVKKDVADTLILKFYNQEGKMGSEDRDQTIILDEKRGRISMGGLEFKRK